ncbi:hypothetical protein OSCT_1371 [Oscillochloris trichoides DG-6]|uniref:Carboxypeptidase regulatory-like domain-containing protein n=1 Tax=Oscillochloris trichoides DG-6 TaxID=765420 RepID=E1IDH0_9CHLR|nr:hypothetical protein OSCT_1371 [Oscillochloris trichoides DG-6]
MILMLCGMLALLIGLTTLPLATVASAQAPEPSPRPPIQPTSDLNQRKPTAVVPGRLTGTVIDLRTGAPASGITVLVGEQALTSDANGNYDAWLVSGYYRLDLKLSATQGTATQPAQVVAVGPGDTVVVHLFFSSPAVTPEATQTVAPIAATPTAVVPTTVALPSLPDTSRVDVPAGMPQSLPNTAAPLGMGSPTTWILLGALLLGLSLVVQLAPRPRRRARLTRKRRVAKMSATRSDEQLLTDLLDEDL